MTYRPDIDGLRAIAVASVVVYHFQREWLPGGFVGVDVFFVISGYVVTASLRAGGEPGLWAKLISFYRKRALRILPALLVCAVCTALLAAFLIPPKYFESPLAAARYSVIGLSNFFFVREEVDYFGIGSDNNPALHFWSLAVEEQFYVLYPILLLTLASSVGRRNVMIVLVLTIVTSGAVSVWWQTTDDAIAAFFLLPSRWWELASGGLLRLLHEAKEEGCEKHALWRGTAPIGMILLCLGLFATERGNWFPVPFALLPVAGTLLIIHAGRCKYSFLTRFLSAEPLVACGKLSYSVYLWHWPILVLFAWTIGVNTPISLALAFSLIALCSLGSYFLLERPIRNLKLPARVVLGGGLGLILLSYVGIGVAGAYVQSRAVDTYNPVAFQSVQSPSDWTDEAKSNHHRYFEGNEETFIQHCLGDEGRNFSEEKKRVFVIGDSHALAFGYAVRSAFEGSEVCVRTIHNDGIPRIMTGEMAPEFDFAANLASKGDVVVLTFFRGKFFNTERVWHIPTDWNPLDVPEVSERVGNLEAFLTAYARRLNKEGAFLVLVDDVPQMRTPARIQQALVQERFGLPNASDVSVEQSRHTRLPMTTLFKQLARGHANVIYWDPHGMFEYDGMCRIRGEDGNLQMIDSNHMSKSKSESLGPQLRAALKACGALQWDE
jgi:peptidoglycan/LPS O-acetylase OafA/YrhL